MRCFRVLLLLLASVAQAQHDPNPRLDPSRPVPAKAAVIAAWQRRQNAIKSFQFSWRESQTHPSGWIPNPRYAEREWLSIAGLRKDRTYSVDKTLAVSGSMMRYTFSIDRAEEPDGIRVRSSNGDTQGLGVRRHYSYVSVFDGHQGETRITSLMDAPPASVIRSSANVDAQNLDTRAILLSLRPLDPVMGHIRMERAVTNQRRFFYKNKSTFFLEERHDPSGWKTILWVEPERDFLISRMAVLFEQKWIADIDIDYKQDPQWGWIPIGWRTTEMLSDGRTRLVNTATVTSYSINNSISAAQFR